MGYVGLSRGTSKWGFRKSREKIAAGVWIFREVYGSGLSRSVWCGSLERCEEAGCGPLEKCGSLDRCEGVG